MGNLLKDRYQLLRELGQGGMGVVFQAHDILLDREIAVKVLNTASRTRLGTEGAARLLHEAQAAARLNHPNIVSIFDAGEDQGISFIVMELIDGESLFDKRPSDIDEILQITRQVCAALEHAHAHGIVHRDLKPENILVTRGGQVKLTDFGLARSVSSRLTVEGMIVGTVLYLAPEAAMRQPYDHRVDLYSLGVMLYELTTGCLPYSGTDPLAVISQHLYAPIVPPRAQNPAISPALESLILQLMNKKPEDRPGSAAAVGRTVDFLLGVSVNDLPVRANLPEPATLDRLVRGRLVGREAELQEMSNAWKAAASGNGRVLLVSGEPGIGKSRIGRELVARAFVSGGQALSGACYPEGGMPYAPFPQIIKEAVEQYAAPNPLPGELLLDLVKIAPQLRARLSAGAPVIAIDPLSEQQHIFESVVTFFQLLADHAPLLLFIDDAHWADSGTLALLRYLARRTRDARILILLTYREIELDDISVFQQVLNDLVRERLSQRLKLTRFDRQQTAVMLGIMLTPHGEMHPGLVDAIYLETEGNPFFIEEVCKALLEEDKLCMADGVWCALDPSQIVIPQSVRVTLQTRIARLTPQTQDVLRMAAILGREFDFPTLLQASGLDEDGLILALESAERAQIIAEVSDRAGTVTFAFVHGLIPTTLSDHLSSMRRQRLHRSAASAIEVVRPNDVETIAYHYEIAGDLARAYQYYSRAADRALSNYANQEAERYFRTAIELSGTEVQSGNLQSGLGRSLYRQSQYREAVDAFLAAADLYCQAGDVDQQAHMFARAARSAWHAGDPKRCLDICLQALEAIPGYMEMEIPGVAALIHETARAYRFEQQNDKALLLCLHALTLARRLGLVEVQAEALTTLGILPNQSAADIRRSLEEAVRLSESAGLLITAMRAHTNLGELLRIWGEFDAARNEFKRGVELAKQMGSTSWEHDQLFSVTELSIDLSDFETVERNLPALKRMQENLPHREYAAIATRTIEARLRRFRGEWEQAVIDLQTCLEENFRHQFYWMSAGLVSTLAELMWEMGRIVEAEHIISTYHKDHPDISPIDRIIPLFLMSIIRGQQGKFEDAHKFLDEGRILVQEHSTNSGLAFMEYTQARLYIVKGEWQSGFDAFASLADILRKSGARWYQARLYSEWADAFLARAEPGDPAHALPLYRQALLIYENLKLPGYIERMEDKLKNALQLPGTQPMEDLGPLI